MWRQPEGPGEWISIAQRVQKKAWVHRRSKASLFGRERGGEVDHHSIIFLCTGESAQGARHLLQGLQSMNANYQSHHKDLRWAEPTTINGPVNRHCLQPQSSQGFSTPWEALQPSARYCPHPPGKHMPCHKFWQGVWAQPPSPGGSLSVPSAL